MKATPIKQLPAHTRGLGIAAPDRSNVLFYYQEGREFHIARSTDGLTFKPLPATLQIATQRAQGKQELINDYSAFHVATVETGKYILVYRNESESKSLLCSARSNDLIHWKQVRAIRDGYESGSIVSHYHHNKNYALYAGRDGKIYLGFSKDLAVWRIKSKVVLAPRRKYFDRFPLSIIATCYNHEGIWVLYSINQSQEGATAYEIGAALFDPHDPAHMIWRSEQPIWKQTGRWERAMLYPLGAVNFGGKMHLYWESDDHIFSTVFSLYKQRISSKDVSVSVPSLKRARGNPIIMPRADHSWESRATFNPTALYEAGKVHIIYRAIGDRDVSVFGYASSKDGVRIDERLDYPVYVPRASFEGSGSSSGGSYSPYMSGGGGSGGCEDPRITKIDGRIYLVYVAYDGATPPRVAMSWISVENFLNKKWKWSDPQLISAPKIVNKNACILPEKIRGKYVIFHRIFPDILIDYVDDLNFDGHKWLTGQYAIPPSRNGWDSRKAGIGATPIKTKNGWLLIYQGVDDRDPGRYKIGAMLLDLQDPTRVLHRSRHPILEPVEDYENVGHKSGVVYPCGAVVVEGRLFVYYGGADTVTCVATAVLDELLHDLVTYEDATLEPVSFDHPLLQ